MLIGCASTNATHGCVSTNVNPGRDPLMIGTLDLLMNYRQIEAVLGLPDTNRTEDDKVETTWLFNDRSCIKLIMNKRYEISEWIYIYGIEGMHIFSQGTIPLPAQLKMAVRDLADYDAVEKLLGPAHERLGYGIDYRKWYFDDHSSLTVAASGKVDENGKLYNQWTENDTSFDKIIPKHLSKK